MNDQYTLEEFAQAIKSKYPEYQGVDNLELANKFLEKYPVYQDSIVEKKNLVGSQEEFEPASMEAFLAFTPTSAQADTDLGFSLERDPEDPFRFLSQEEKELAEAANFYNSVDPITGAKISTAIAPQMATRESAEVLQLQRESQAEQEKKEQDRLAEAIVDQYEGRALYGPIGNTLLEGVDGMVTNIRNSIASRTVARKDLFGSAREADQLNKLIEESRKDQEAEKTAQKVLAGASVENVEKGIFENFKEGNIDDGFASIFVDGIYAAIDAPRTALPFITGAVPGAVFTGLTSGSVEYSRLMSDPTISKQERVSHAMSNGIIEGVLAGTFGSLGIGAQAVFQKLGSEVFRKSAATGIRKASSGLSQFLKSSLGEAGEEATVSALTQLSDQIIKSQFGKEPDEFNAFEVFDAAALGFIGGAGPGAVSSATISSLPSSKAAGHSSLDKEKQELDSELAELQAAYANEKDPDIKAARFQDLQDKLAAYDAMNGMQEQAYASLNDKESVQIASVNRRILNLEAQVERGSDLAGIEYNADQIKAKQEEIKSLKDIKGRIESNALSREYAADNQGQLPLFVEDSNGNEVEISPVNTPKAVTEEHSKMVVEESPEEEQQAASFILDTEQMAEESKPASFAEINAAQVTAQSLADNQVPTEFHQPIINLTSAFKNVVESQGLKVIFHKDADSYATAIMGENDAATMVENNNVTLGNYSPTENTIHLYDYTKLDVGAKLPPIVDTVRHEFSHAVFRSIIADNSEARSRLFTEVEKLASENKRINDLIDGVRDAYKSDGEAVIQEEAIVALLVDYAGNPSSYDRTLTQKIIDFVNNVLGIGNKEVFVKDETDLLGLARSFASAAKTGRKTEVESESRKAAENQSRKASKPFTYLEQAEIYYIESQTTGRGDVSAFGTKRLSPRRQSVKVNDYNHYRNWYNKMTANGRVKTITDMYHIVDGKKRKINPPKPRLNKDGTVMYMEAPSTFLGRKADSIRQKQQDRVDAIKAVNAARKAAFKVMDDFGLNSIRMSLFDFMPREEGIKLNDFNRIEKTPEMFEAAIRNMQALMESGFDAKESSKRDFARNESIEMFTMAEQDYKSPMDEINDDLTKPDEDGGPTYIGTSKASRFLIDPKTLQKIYADFDEKLAIDPKSIAMFTGKDISQQAKDFAGTAGLELVDKDYVEDEFGITMGYDLTMHQDFGQVDLAGIKYSINSGITSRSFMSARSEKKGKELADKLNGVAEMARKEGKNSVDIRITAQNPKEIFGNTQVFESVLDYLFNYKKQTGQSTEETDKQDVSRLKSFLIDRDSGSLRAFGNKRLNGKETKPGVINVLRRSLPEFMQDSGNYSDYIARNKGELKVDTKEDYDDLFLAIKEFVSVDGLAKDYLSKQSKTKLKIQYLQDAFKFRIDLMDSFASIESGLYATSREENPGGLNATAIKARFVNPMLEKFDSGEIIAVQRIQLEDGEVFGVEKKQSEDGNDPFPFAVTYKTFDPDKKTLKVLKKRYSFWDFHPKLLRETVNAKFKEAFKEEDARYRVSEDQGADFNPASFQKLRQRAIERALLGGVRGSILRGGFVSQTQFSTDAVKAKRAGLLVFADTNINQDKFSKPLFIDVEDSSGNTWTMRTKTSTQMWRDKWLRRLQDKYRDVFLLQEDVETFKGRSVKESEDFKMAEETMYGKAANDLRILDERLDGITSAIKDSNITADELSEYLYALHAEERNRVIEERTKGDVKDGSGLSTEEANTIINSYTGEKKQSLDDIVSMVREIQQDTRDTMVKFGLETNEAIKSFESMYSNYIPLSGLSIDEDSSVSSPYPTGGAGLSVFGSTTRRAKGRKSRAENVLAQAVAQNASVHIQARKNEAMQSLYNLVKNNPNPNVWKIVDGASEIDPNVVPVRVDGVQKFIRFKDASYASTLKNMNMPQTNHFIRLLRMPSNWLRAAFTTQNPEFLLSNFSRDIQSAVFNAAAESEIEGGFLNGKRAMKDMFNKVGPSLNALLKGATGREAKMDPVIKRYYEEYQEDGGKTGWAYAKPLDEIAERLQGDAKNKNKAQQILGGARNALEFVEGVNDAFENSIRLAGYIAARENGVSRGKAAQFAKNITVNFNKHGEYGQVLNAVYLFFNASVQGTARLGRSLTGLKPPVKPDGSTREWYERATTAQKMAGGLTLFNGMLTMLGMAMSDEDEDGVLYWTKIPDYVKERNIVIMRPDGKNYFKIPMPYGFNVFANMGTAAVEGAAGTRDLASASMFVASSFINSFSPISFGASKDLSTKALKSVVPTPLKPIVDIVANETYFGSPVYSKRWDESMPESSMSFRSPEMVKSFFSWMNEATGGSQEVPGALDFNPDKLWYGVEYFMGGPGLFVERTSKTVRRLNAKVINKEDVDIGFNDVPMLRIIYGEPSKYYDMEVYSDRVNLLKGLEKEMERTRDFNNPRYRGVTKLRREAKKTESKLRKLRKQRKEVRNITDFGKRTAETQRLMDLERSEIMKFNKYYDEQRQD